MSHTFLYILILVSVQKDCVSDLIIPTIANCVCLVLNIGF